jgi:mannosyl-3-phosphoglycerate phosphatase
MSGNIQKTAYKLLIFTDIDGTFLDLKTYEAALSLPALRKCERLMIPVVFVSSKTRAEIERLRFEFQSDSAFVSENGCGIFLPKDTHNRPKGAKSMKNQWSISMGVPYQSLVKALADAAASAGVRIKGFNDLTEEELIKLTGLSPAAAILAKQREFDEPFCIENDSPAVRERLIREIEKQGFKYSMGGTFHHITGRCDKGDAIMRLKEFFEETYPDIKFAAIGDAPNDLPMLRQVDYPFLVRKPDGSYVEEIVFPGLTVTKGIGPAGFEEAVESLISTMNIL